MQQDRSAHYIPGLPNCLIDGFKHSLDHVSEFNNRIFFLTHYHSDHYTGLYQGWKAGHIFCSSTTARLLIKAMKIKRVDLIHPVGIGETVSIPGARVTFLDANHCPGASMLLFQLDSGLTHLHTGDMRYHPRMKEFTALKEAKIDKVYLDTTYAHPKHQFKPQAEAIDDIIRKIKDFLFIYRDSGLVYLSAYNLGKERVIFAVQDAIGAPIYMDEDKINIMNQIEGGAERVASGMFTSNPLEANIHICGMGFAGFVGQYFRANFDNLENSRIQLNALKQASLDNIGSSTKSPSQLTTEFTHVLAFIPTGWAESSSYNRSHSYQVQEHLAVQLVPYSEHSQYQELMDFVEFLKPREVIPTVYADDRNRVYIVHLFRNLVDKKQNMQNFLNKFNRGDKPLVIGVDSKGENTVVVSMTSSSSASSQPYPRLSPDIVILDDDVDDDEEVVAYGSESEKNKVSTKKQRAEIASHMDVVDLEEEDHSSSPNLLSAPPSRHLEFTAPAGGMMNLWLKTQRSGSMESMGGALQPGITLPPLPLPTPLSISQHSSASSLSSINTAASQSALSMPAMNSSSNNMTSLLPPPIVTNPSFISSSIQQQEEQQQLSNVTSRSTMVAAMMRVKSGSESSPIASASSTASTQYPVSVSHISSSSTTQRSTPRKRTATEVVSDRISREVAYTLSTSESISPKNLPFSTSNNVTNFHWMQQQQHIDCDGNGGVESSPDDNHHHKDFVPRIGSIQSYSMDEQELVDVVPSIPNPHVMQVKSTHSQQPQQLNTNGSSTTNSIASLGLGGLPGLKVSTIPISGASSGNNSSACTPTMAMLNMRSRAVSVNENLNSAADEGPRVHTPSQKKMKLSPTITTGPTATAPISLSMNMMMDAAEPVLVYDEMASIASNGHTSSVSFARPSALLGAVSTSMDTTPVVAPPAVHYPTTTTVASSISGSSSSNNSQSYVVPPTPRGRRAPPMSSWTTYSTTLITPSTMSSANQCSLPLATPTVPSLTNSIMPVSTSSDTHHISSNGTANPSYGQKASPTTGYELATVREDEDEDEEFVHNHGTDTSSNNTMIVSEEISLLDHEQEKNGTSLSSSSTSSWTCSICTYINLIDATLPSSSSRSAAAVPRTPHRLSNHVPGYSIAQFFTSPSVTSPAPQHTINTPLCCAMCHHPNSSALQHKHSPNTTTTATIAAATGATSHSHMDISTTEVIDLLQDDT